MILVTVGTQGPFDRLVRAVDAWAARRPAVDVLAQIGRDAWQPDHLRWVDYMSRPMFRSALDDADLVVTHAGIGTLVTILERGKPAIVMPRQARLHEQRNDHQLATAQHFCGKHNLPVAADGDELAVLLDEAMARPARDSVSPPQLAPAPELLDCVRRFIEAPR